MWVKLGIEDPHVTLLSIFEFRQNQYTERPTLHFGLVVCVNETWPCFLQVSTDMDKIRSRTRYRTLADRASYVKAAQ